MSEIMYSGNLPMNYTIATNGNLLPSVCGSEPGDQFSGWRVCYESNSGATPTWRSHITLRQYLDSYPNGFEIGSLGFPTVTDFINYSSNGSIVNAQGLYDLFNDGGEFALVRTGDYIFMNQSSPVFHGFLIVGWGLAVDTLLSLNARLESEPLSPRQVFSIDKRPNRVPYMVDFCYGYTGTVNPASPENNKTGWLQDPRPRPFYTSAVRIADSNLFNTNIVGMSISSYWQRLRTLYAPFVFGGDPNVLPNWTFIRVPEIVEVRFDRLFCG